MEQFKAPWFFTWSLSYIFLWYKNVHFHCWKNPVGLFNVTTLMSLDCYKHFGQSDNWAEVAETDRHFKLNIWSLEYFSIVQCFSSTRTWGRSSVSLFPNDGLLIGSCLLINPPLLSALYLWSKRFGCKICSYACRLFLLVGLVCVSMMLMLSACLFVCLQPHCPPSASRDTDDLQVQLTPFPFLCFESTLKECMHCKYLKWRTLARWVLNTEYSWVGSGENKENWELDQSRDRRRLDDRASHGEN